MIRLDLNLGLNIEATLCLCSTEAARGLYSIAIVPNLVRLCRCEGGRKGSLLVSFHCCYKSTLKRHVHQFVAAKRASLDMNQCPSRAACRIKDDPRNVSESSAGTEAAGNAGR